MKLIGSDIYASVPELIKVGIGEDYIKTSCRRNRNNDITSWINIPDPTDNRRVLILVDSLPSKTKAKFLKHYNAASLKAWATNQATQQLTQYIQTDDAELNYFRTLESDDNKAYYTEKEAQELTKAAAWLRFLGSLPRQKVEIKKYGFTTKGDLLKSAHKYLIDITKLKGLDRVRNYRKFQNKIAAYRNEGPECLVSKKFGNENSAKLTDIGKKLLRQLYSKHQKFAYTQVWEQYTKQIMLGDGEDLIKVSLSTVKGYLSQPQIQIQCGVLRHGKQAIKNLYEPTFRRKRPSYDHAFWVMDGTPIELYFQEDGKYHHRMYGFFVMDAGSWNIVGYVLGSSETEAMVFEGIKSACLTSGYLPDQLQYDNSSAIKSKDMLNWYETLTKYHTAAAVGNAKAKTIEPAFGKFNEHVLRFEENYAGANITAKKLDSKVNAEWLRKNKHSLPDREGVTQQIHNTIITWNVMYPLKGNSQARPLTLEDRVSIFWKYRMKNRQDRQTYKYTKDGLTIQIGKTRFNYVVYGTDNHIDYEFYRTHAGKSFNVKYDSDDMTMIALYEGDKFLTYADEVKLMPMAIVDRKKGDGAYINKAIHKRKEFWQGQDELNALDAHPIIDEVEAEGYAKAPIPVRGKQKDLVNASMEIVKTKELTQKRTYPRGIYDVEGDCSIIEIED